MRSHFNICLSAAMALLLLTGSAPVVHAQSLIQSLFGNLFKSAPARPPRATSPAPGAPSPAKVVETALSPNARYRALSKRKFRRSGHYRTYCVRQCDGYYFPISSVASRKNFREAEEECQTRCRGAELYYLPKTSTDIEEMVDMSGHRYDELPSAFVYRKTLIDGCSCRPMPWSATERARHNRYAYRDEVLRLATEREDRLKEQALHQAEVQRQTDQAENGPVQADTPLESGAAQPGNPTLGTGSARIHPQSAKYQSKRVAKRYSKVRKAPLKRRAKVSWRKRKTYSARKYAWPGDR